MTEAAINQYNRRNTFQVKKVQSSLDPKARDFKNQGSESSSPNSLGSPTAPISVTRLPSLQSNPSLGWEAGSPQAVIWPELPTWPAKKKMPPPDTDEDEGSRSPGYPPHDQYPSRGGSPVAHPVYWPPQYYHAPPEYYDMHRAGSPPPFHGHGSPPIPSGYVQVPVYGSMYGSSPPYTHPPGSSPPYGNYPYYPVHMPHQPPPSGPSGSSPEESSVPASLTRQLSDMNLNSQGKAVEGRASARIARSTRAGGEYDPKSFEFRVSEAESGVDEARTTLMIRNLPNRFTSEMLLALLNEAGFDGTFDFFYLPMDFRSGCNLGYAFINFVHASITADVYRTFHGQRWEEEKEQLSKGEAVSRKVAEVTYGRVQGRDALVQHFKSARFPSNDASLMPLVYRVNSEGMALDPLSLHAFLASIGNSPDSTSSSSNNE